MKLDIEYMNANQYKELMQYSGFVESEAVKLFLQFAKRATSIRNTLMKQYEKTPSVVLEHFIKEQEQERIESVWKAYWTAQSEHKQGWRYIEDAEDFMVKMYLKHEGDLTKCDSLETAQIEYINTLDEQRRKQKELV